MNQDVEYQDFVEQVVNTNNNVKIMDIQDDATVNVWADTYGFSIVELAMIQPTYGACWGTYQLYGCSTLETIKLFARELKEASSPSEISDLREQFFRTLFPPFLLLVIIPIIASIYAIKKGVDIKKVSITLLVCFFIFIFFKHY